MEKAFFKERSVAQIRALEPRPWYSLRKLVEQACSIADDEALELRVDLHPPGASYDPPDYKRDRTGAEQSRMLRKRGETLALPTRSLERTRELRRSIIDDLDARLPFLGRPGEGRSIGYRFKPVSGADRTGRYVFWDDLADGQRLAQYAAAFAPIEITDAYELEDGTTFTCTIPATGRKERRYRYQLSSVPSGADGPVDARGLRAGMRPGADRRPTIALYRPLRGRAPGNEGLHRVLLIEQDVAAYAAYALQRAEEGDTVPFEQRPFAYLAAPLQHLDERLRNNVIVYDPTLAAQENTRRHRKLHEEERARVLGWGVAALGAEAFIRSPAALKREIFKLASLQ